MTLDDWLSPNSTSDCHAQLAWLTNRKLHFLTAALLRRVWDDLPSDLTRIAVDATEKHADGRMTAQELARLRSADMLETCEPLWTDSGYVDNGLIGMGCWCCEDSPRVAEYECRAARNGYVLDGVSAAVHRPAAGVLRAARFVRELVAWKADDNKPEAEQAESLAQFDILCDIAGVNWTNPRWPRWRTTDVVALARGIHRDQAFDRLPILADALQDGGCDDADVLQHCQRLGGHVRGCWVVNLAMGFD